jgi:hypothetical protein
MCADRDSETGQTRATELAGWNDHPLVRENATHLDVFPRGPCKGVEALGLGMVLRLSFQRDLETHHERERIPAGLANQRQELGLGVRRGESVG